MNTVSILSILLCSLSYLSVYALTLHTLHTQDYVYISLLDVPVGVASWSPLVTQSSHATSAAPINSPVQVVLLFDPSSNDLITKPSSSLDHSRSYTMRVESSSSFTQTNFERRRSFSLFFCYVNTENNSYTL